MNNIRTKKPVLIAERERLQDTGKIFDEQIYNKSRFSNPSPYPLTASESPNAISAPVAETLDNPTTNRSQTVKKQLAITPYPETTKGLNDNGKSNQDEVFRNPRLGNEAVFNENIVDRFSSIKGQYDKWENVRNIALITTIVATINAFALVLGYMNGEISGLGSIIGNGIMFVILFLIVLFSWFMMVFVRNLPVKGYYSRADIKTKRVVAKYEPVLKSYFLDFMATRTIRERLHAISAMPTTISTIKTVTNFDNNVNNVNNININNPNNKLSSRAVMLIGFCVHGDSIVPISVTLNFNKNYSKLYVQDYKIG